MRPGCCRVNRGEPFGSSGLSEFVSFIGVCYECRRRIHRGAPYASLGSSGVAGFIGVRPEGRQIRLVSLGSLRCALGVAELIGGSLDSLTYTLSIIWCRWVHWGEPWWTSGTSCVAVLIGVRLGGHRVHL